MTNRIIFIGSGNVASVLAPTLKKKYKIVQVYSKTLSNAQKLAKSVSSAYTNDLKKITKDADIYIIAVKDDAIDKVASALRLPGKIVVNTSGNVDMEAIKEISTNCGVLYPPHGFKKGEHLPKNVPFCIEASNTKVKNVLTRLVRELSGKSYYMNSAQRAQLHLAGVFSNNFTNHMLVIANDVATRANIPFEIILHLISDIVEKSKHHKPLLNQTGPAVRRDNKVLKRQEDMLKNNQDYLSIYKLLSKSIQKTS